MSYSRNRRNRSGLHSARRTLLTLLVWWAWTPVLYGLGWCLRLVTPGHAVQQFIDQWFYANFLVLGGLAWVWLTIGFLGSAVIIGAQGFNSGRGLVPATALIAAFVLTVGAFIQAWRVNWDADKDLARYYDAATVFYTPALSGADAPPSLDRLVNGAHQPSHGGTGGCALVGGADVPSCVRVGTLTDSGWEPRLGSLNGAIYALSRSSGSVQNVSLNNATVRYLNAWHGLPARWSGILDGHGISQGMGGVADWNGSKVTTCSFTGRYAIDRSFSGTNMADMPDYLAQSYPGLKWTIGDVWGYCASNEPVVIVPVTKIQRQANRTVDTAAGIIEIHGDNGKTKLTYEPSVQAGALPGPVYPESLVKTQLQEVSWAAGRGSMNNDGFGYKPTTSSAQAGNTSDYLLRSVDTGRLEWVTPLTLRNSSSELFVAYAVSSADTVTDGQLNQLSIYALSPADPREINVDNMEAEARNWLTQEEPGFISSGGKLLEFTPVGGNQWRAYGELNGRVVYLLDIDATGSVTPTLTSVSSFSGNSGSASGPAAGSGATAVCGKPLSTLTTAQLSYCLKAFADQLSTREEAP